MPTRRPHIDTHRESSAASPGPDVSPDTPSAPSRARGLADAITSLLPGIRGQTASTPPPQTPPTNPAVEEPELLDLLLSGPDAMLVIHRQAGEIVEVNSRFCAWTGITRTNLLGKPIASIFAESEQRAVKKLYAEAGSGGIHVIELPSAETSSTAYLVEFTCSVSPLGGGQFAVIIGRDVGERAMTERYLRSERDRMNAIIRSMRDVLVMLSSSGDIEYANPAAEQTFEPFELPIVCHRWLQTFSKDERTDLQGMTSAYVGKTMELEATNGRVFLVTRSFLFESSQRANIMLMAKDITDQKVVERQNHQLELELMRETKLAEFGMFSAGIAHNLRGPLTGILGFCDLLDMKHVELREIQQIRQQALTMNAIISNLMHKSRSEQETEPQDLMLEDIVRTELQFLDANLFFKHNVEKIVETDSNIPTIHGVYSDLSQVIGNLLRNAIDAMHESDQKVLTVKLCREDKSIVFAVTDTGHGIPEELKQKIFQPFFTTKPKANEAIPGMPTGTGLGLSSSRGILARYGADLQLESSVGRGSTFTIRFPLNRKYAAQGAKEQG
ncbi:PAS domain-containing sensor histidine kinase [candidate division KSB1 bacterium]|nr:PAS domain-containing sensor histidine kinase [candidate division KSB1 bacterium]